MDWVNEEMRTIELGDERLNQRAIKLLSDLSRQPLSSIPSACGTWAETKAAYRFFDNEKVTAGKILQPHITATLQRIAQQERILLIQDTTELDYSGQKQKQDVGPSHSDENRALHLHPLLAVTPDKVCLGIVKVHQWHRKELHRHQHNRREMNNINLHHQSIEEKESYRWLEGYRRAQQIAKDHPNTHVIMVADREADIFEIYDESEYASGKKADWLIRASHNRALLTEEGKRGPLLLKEKLLKTSPVGQIKFQLPKRDTKPSREVTQTIRVLRIQLHPPTGRRGKLRLRSAWVTAILAREENPPTNCEAVEWLLLTNIILNEQITFFDIVNWYLARWQIEIFFYILKKGCRIEAIQLTAAKRFMPCFMLYLITAWRILFITHFARQAPEACCELVFTQEEWQTVYLILKKKPPIDPPSLFQIVKLIAQCGGFLGRKRDGSPGVKTIWLGLQRLQQTISTIDFLKQTTCG